MSKNCNLAPSHSLQLSRINTHYQVNSAKLVLISFLQSNSDVTMYKFTIKPSLPGQNLITNSFSSTTSEIFDILRKGADRQPRNNNTDCLVKIRS